MQDHALAKEIVSFWQEIGPKGWYAGTAEIDDLIAERFSEAVMRAEAGAFGDWLQGAEADCESALAYLLLTDQFPRNIRRGRGDAFALDARALKAAEIALERGWDLEQPEPLRQFFYLPWMHSEDPEDQARSVALFAERLPGTDNLRHARAHRRVIAQFGRFPYRNAALGRQITAAEQDFLDQGGYRLALEQVDAGE